MLTGLVMPAAMLVLGGVLIAQALSGGGPLRVLLGVLFLAAGAGRLYVERRSP